MVFVFRTTDRRRSNQVRKPEYDKAAGTPALLITYGEAFLRLILSNNINMAEPPEITRMAVDDGKDVDSPMETQVERMAEKVWSESSLESYKQLFMRFPEQARFTEAIKGLKTDIFIAY